MSRRRTRTDRLCDRDQPTRLGRGNARDHRRRVAKETNAAKEASEEASKAASKEAALAPIMALSPGLFASG